MDSNGHYPYDEIETIPSKEGRTVEHVGIAQLRRLVQLLDESDVSEIEVSRAEEGMHLVLRKAGLSDGLVAGQSGDYQVLADAEDGADVTLASPVETRHTITAPLVGIFHSWARPKGKALVSVGDTVKIGQRVGTIQSLNVLNEVETTIAGCVVEILVEGGQAVEYGQQLMVIDSSEEA